MNAAVCDARAILSHVTPLKRDCGRVCGARCCRSLEGEETGMLLFPGESDVYADKENWKILHAAQGDVVVCPGQCNRDERPLSCRMFPLLPLTGETGEIRVVTDQRARAVCPLARQGKSAMDPAFIEAVREAGRILARDAEEEEFLGLLAKEQEEMKELRRRFLQTNRTNE